MGNSRQERDFTRLLERYHGYKVVNSTASGGGTEGDRPDGAVGKNGEVWVFEHKYGDANVLYLEGDEVDTLEEFADEFGARAKYVFRFSQDRTHYVVEKDSLRETQSGEYNYAFSRDMAATLNDVAGFREQD